MTISEIQYWKADITIPPELKKKYFGEGEWVNERDVVNFTYLGYPCAIFRVATPDPTEEQMFGGHLCGYVKLPDGQTYEAFSENDWINCHGGVTFAEESLGSQHFLESGFWVGFDCAHAWDVVPSMKQLSKSIADIYSRFQACPPSYKNIGFVFGECKEIVRQLIEAKK